MEHLVDIVAERIVIDLRIVIARVTADIVDMTERVDIRVRLEAIDHRLKIATVRELFRSSAIKFFLIDIDAVYDMDRPKHIVERMRLRDLTIRVGICRLHADLDTETELVRTVVAVTREIIIIVKIEHRFVGVTEIDVFCQRQADAELIGTRKRFFQFHLTVG